MVETRGLWWVVLFLAIGSGFLVGGWLIPAGLFYFVGISVAIWLPAVSFNESAAYLKTQQRDFIKAFFEADPESRAALGLKYPKLRVKIGDQVSVTVGDSGVELRYFKIFMLDSNTEFMAARSNYGDRTKPGKQWKLFREYLQREGAVLQDRGKVTETWRWKNENEYWRYYGAYVNLNVPPELRREVAEIPAGTQAIPAEDGIERAFR